jgi:hypothetical protein
MGAAVPRGQAVPMLTPIVTEISRAFEPVVRDTFIRDAGLRDPREPAASAGVVSLAAYRAAAGAPARAA